MYLYTLYERSVDKGRTAEEYEDILRLLAYIEAKTRYETLVQVLELISEAKKNATLEDLEKIVDNWKTDANDLYKMTLLDELVFQWVLDNLDLLELKKKAKSQA